MNTDKNREITDSSILYYKSDPSLFVDTVREKLRLKIDEINISADAGIDQINSVVDKEIREFRDFQKNKHEELVKYEGSKIRNLSAIEMKKQKLERIESFIKIIINEAAISIRQDQRYGEFLNSCVVSALENVKGMTATVLISANDMIYSSDLTDKIKNCGYNFKFSINSDDRAKSGGAMVIDDEAEVIYNNTVERIIYRKNDEIRREIVRNLKNFEINREG